MSDELTLPENWQQHPDVLGLVEKAMQEANTRLQTEQDVRKRLQEERDALKRELLALKQELAANATSDMDHSPSSPRTQQLLERVQALETELRDKTARLNQEVVERGIREAVALVGEVHKDAWPDVIARGKAMFSINEQGAVQARDVQGTAIFAKDGVTPLDFKEWARNLQAEAPHLFKASTGSGGSGGAGTSADTKGRPVIISKEQARNPLLYRRAKERATKLGSELLIQ